MFCFDWEVGEGGGGGRVERGGGCTPYMRDDSVVWAEVYRLLFSSLPLPPPPPLLFVCLGFFVVCFFVFVFVFFVFFYMSIIWVYIMSRVRPAGHLVWQKFSDGHYTQTVQPIFFFFFFFFLPAILAGTIDFYHFIPHSLTLTLTGGHKVSAE